MQPPVDSKLSCDAMKIHGMEGVFFCTFPSKKATAHFSLNNYTQSISGEFSCCSFTGKERDEETGYGYFGARYMDHELMTMWLSVDPLADKYPGISPYNYCMWNSVRLSDPNGEDPVFYGLLQYQKRDKHGNDHVGETQIVGNFHVVPFYDDKNTLIGYNAGRFRSDGNYVVEYQMDPSDLNDFFRNYEHYEYAADWLYYTGEPDWSYVAMINNLYSGDIGGVLSELGKMWCGTLQDPGFWFSLAISITDLGVGLPNTNSTEQFISGKVSSLQRQICKHQEKLGGYLSNSISMDNKGFLVGAPYTKFKNVFDGRVKHLEHEIHNFKKEIEKERKKSNGRN